MVSVHGGDVYRQEIEYDFSVNINPLGMPLASVRAAHEGVALAGRYPDVRGEKLVYAIAEARHVTPEHIILGNGAAELIYMFCHTVLPKKTLTIAPTFTEYEAAVRAVGGKMIHYLLPHEFTVGKDFLDLIDNTVNVVFLCNPNNPTGKLIEPSLMEKILERCRAVGAYLMVDECFMPFVEENDNYSLLGTRLNYRQYNHVIVLRAFTKIYAMAGLRLGVAISSDTDLLDGMHRQTQPWNVSIPAQMAGVEALKDFEYLDKTRDMLKLEKLYLFKELYGGPVKKIYDTVANYILFRAEPDLKKQLLDKGILIRSCQDFVGLSEEYFRIGIRSHSENQALIRALKEIYL